MNCTDFQKDVRFVAAISGGAPSSGIRAHFRNCGACSAWLAAERKRSDRLELFVQRLEGAPESRKGPIAWLKGCFGR